MAEGCLADLSKQTCLPHNAKIRRKRLVGRAHPQAGHDVGIGLPPIPLQLPAAVRQAVHPHVLAEPQFVRSVLPFRLAAVPRRTGANELAANPQFFSLGCKEGFQVAPAV